MADKRDNYDLDHLRQRLQTGDERIQQQSKGRRVKARPASDRSGGGPALLLGLISIAALLGTLALAYYFFQFDQRQQALEEELRAQLAEVTSNLQALQERLDDSSKKIGSVSSGLNTVRDGVSRSEAQIALARRLVDEIRRNQERQRELLNRQIEAKADSNQVVELKQTSQAKFEEIDGQLTEVSQELEANRQELEKTWSEMEKLGLRLTDQGRLIATNSGGLQELRNQQGERDYKEFDVQKNVRTRIGNIALELRKTNRDKQFADVRLLIDDRNVDRDKIYANSPLVFYVGKDRVEYELVINEIEKNRMRGYVSILSSPAAAK